MKNKFYDVIVIGAGAAGLMAAAQAGKQGLKVILLEHTDKIGEKIRISGGGRCNFTNLNTSPNKYISNNPHFAISALAQYTQFDFIKLVESYNITYHEKTLGQLFCDSSSKQIINMLTEECNKAHVILQLNCNVASVTKTSNFELITNIGNFSSRSLIIATGGLSIPKLGASNFGYKIAKQFGLKLIQTRPALVPLTVMDSEIGFFRELSGVSINSITSYKKTSFKENILFTHRGLSGPAILQISSYLDKYDEDININLLPEINLKELFSSHKNSKGFLNNFLKDYLPNRFVEKWSTINKEAKKIADYKAKDLDKIADSLHNFTVRIAGTEGYAKAEVTAGGIDTNELSSKTMCSKRVPNLYFIGEVVDVTGWLGGYNFQWAWSSGYVAGNHVACL